MDQIDKPIINETNEESWKRHVLAGKAFSGTNKEYCRLNGLDHRNFSFHKRKLGFSKTRKQAKAFIEVKSLVNEGITLPRPPESKRALPDAKWLADFAVALLSGGLK